MAHDPARIAHISPEPIPRTRERGAVTRMTAWLTRLLGLRSAPVVAGFRYRPVGRNNRATGLAFSYIVETPVASPLKIRPTEDRIYDDLSPDPRRVAAESLRDFVPPAGRTLVAGCGTGGAAEAMRLIAGPAGGVIAIDDDHESIRFARRRYSSGNIGFERGRLDHLNDELGATFDAAFIISTWLRDPIDVDKAAHCIATPGDLLVFCPTELELNRSRTLLCVALDYEVADLRIVWSHDEASLLHIPIGSGIGRDEGQNEAAR